MSSDYSEDEVKAMLEDFKEMGVKPKAKTKDEFQKWMLDFSKGAISKHGQQAGASAQQGGQDKHPTYYQPPRLPTFSGDKKGDLLFPLFCKPPLEYCRRCNIRSMEIPSRVSFQREQLGICDSKSHPEFNERRGSTCHHAIGTRCFSARHYLQT